MRFVGIDPSTKTGIVIFDKQGNLIDSLEITGKGKDPSRMAGIIVDTIEQLEPNDFVAIEGFGFASQTGFLLGGIGWGMRMEMFHRSIRYIEVAPAALKKFASGKGNTKKDELSVHIYKHWGFESKSDNVRDAYVLARIAESIHSKTIKTKYQMDVIQTILNPPEKKRKKA